MTNKEFLFQREPTQTDEPITHMIPWGVFTRTESELDTEISPLSLL